MTSIVTISDSAEAPLYLKATANSKLRNRERSLPRSLSGASKDVIAQADRRRVHHEADVVIVGAGIFGCAAAYAFASQGRSVILLERSMKEPDRIVGEYLQPGGCAALEKLGLKHCLEGIDAVRARGYEIIYYGQTIKIPYPSELASGPGIGYYDPEVQGPRRQPEGRSFHHGRLIGKLRQACASSPNITIFETEATETVTSSSDKSPEKPTILGMRSRTMNAETGEKTTEVFFAPLTIIADGYKSEFRKQYVSKKPVTRSKFYALELQDCPLPSPLHGHVVLGDAAPILLYQIGTHETRALIDVPTDLPAASASRGGVRAYIRDVVVPSLPPNVQPCFRAALADGKIPRSMPNSWLGPSLQQERGLLILGDAMNMRHPLTGGGMTVAFNDVVLLSDLLNPSRIPDLSDTQSVQRAMRTFHWQRKGLTSVINMLAQALYSLFAASTTDARMKTLQRGCFFYLQKGGTYQQGPIGLLGGIIRRPIVLVYHFFAVAVFSLRILCAEHIHGVTDLWRLPLLLIQACLVFWKAVAVIGPYLLSELRT